MSGASTRAERRAHEEKVAYPATTQNAAILNFRKAQENATKIMEDASRVAGLPDLYRVQAESAAVHCGIRLHRIIGEADAADLYALAGDLEALTKRSWDPLVSMIGAEAASAAHGIEAELFDARLWGALDGNALFNLEQIAERLDEGDDE